MKKMLLVVLSILFWSGSASAGMSCKTDYFGNYVCTGTGADAGYQSTTKRDYFGNDVTTDNRGNRQTCKTDYFGNYVCN